MAVRKAYCPRRPDLPHLPVLFPNLGTADGAGRNPFVDAAYRCFTEPIVEVVDDPARADAILIPHHFRLVRGDRAYLAEIAALAARHGKRVVAVNYGDAPCAVDLPNSVAFVSSAYRYSLRRNEVMMPAYAEDLHGPGAFAPRPKGERPVVGFCGWSDYKNARNAVGTWVGNALVRVRARLAWDERILSERKGLSFRREALDILRKEPGIRTNFLIRKSYSGHVQTISLPPEQARREYVENLRDCDLALVAKGDGNYSYRFYEALSLGRIPLFVDTETPLPLEAEIDYGSFVLWVRRPELPWIGVLARDWWRGTTPEEIERRQLAARAAFTDYLRPDRFFARAFAAL
jgi:hypothetical protein